MLKVTALTLVLSAMLVSPTLTTQAMAQSSSGAQSGSQANNNINFDSGPAQAPGISAPGLAVSVGSCARSNSGGFSVGGLGVAIGGTVVDAKCDTRQDMLALHATQQGGTVVRMRACADEDMARAYAAAGQPCPQAAHASTLPVYTMQQAVGLNGGNPVWDVSQGRYRTR